MDEAKAELFLEELGNGCNVARAAKIAGLSSSQVYRRRARDAGFRAGWSEALCIGYARLEMEMLERALVGTEKAIKVNGESQVVRDYDDRMGLALLKMHRETVGEIERGVDEQEYEEACARVIAKLARLRERQEAGRAERREQKAAVADGLPGGKPFAGSQG